MHQTTGVPNADTADRYAQNGIMEARNMEPECPMCSGQGVLLGGLGQLVHYRCRQCGWVFSQPVEEEPEEELDGIRQAEA